MGALTGKAPSTTFKDLLTVNSAVDGQGIETSLKTVFDGEGVASSMELSSDDINISTHNGSSKGLKLAGTVVSSTAAEINFLDGKTTSNSGNIVTTSGTQTLDEKVLDGGSFT
jgi:hypothetical protein